MRALDEEAEQSLLYSSRRFGKGGILTVPCGDIALAGMLAHGFSSPKLCEQG